MNAIKSSIDFLIYNRYKELGIQFIQRFTILYVNLMSISPKILETLFKSNLYGT